MPQKRSLIINKLKTYISEQIVHTLNRFDLPLTNQQVKNIEYYKPKENSPEIKYLKECRLKLGGNLPERSSFAQAIKTPSIDIFNSILFAEVKLIL